MLPVPNEMTVRPIITQDQIVAEAEQRLKVFTARFKRERRQRLLAEAGFEKFKPFFQQASDALKAREGGD